MMDSPFRTEWSVLCYTFKMEKLRNKIGAKRQREREKNLTGVSVGGERNGRFLSRGKQLLGSILPGMEGTSTAERNTQKKTAS